MATGSAWLRVSDVAGMLGVSRNTVRRWTDEGVLTSYRSPGGHRRYLRDEVMAAIAARRSERIDGPLPERFAADPDLVGSLRRQIETLDASLTAGLDLIGLLLHEPAGVSRVVAEKLSRLTGVPTCEVATLDGAVLRVVASFADGEPREERYGAALDPAPRRRIADGAVGSQPFAVFTAGRPRLPAVGRRLLEERCCRSLLVVPLLVDGMFAGSVELCDAIERDFDREIGVVRGFAEIATQALKVATFVERLAARDRAARELVELSSLASQAASGDELLRGVTRRLSTAIEASGCDIYGTSGDKLVTVASARRGEEAPNWVGVEYSLDDYPATATSIATREPLIITDPADPRLSPTEAQLFLSHGNVAECVLPLYSGDRLVGILDIVDDSSADFLDYLDLIRGVGQIVADSLVKARLLSDLGRQNKLMGELVELGSGIAASADGVGHALHSLGVRLLETIDADTCEIYSLDGGGAIELLAGFDREGTSDEWIGWTGNIADFPTSAAAIAARSVLIVASLDDPRLSDNERERFAMFDYESEICIPLVVDGEPIGFLDIFDTRSRDFGEFAGFLRGFAPVLARTIQNAVLLREVEQRNAALHDLVQLGELVSQVSDVGELLRLTALRLLVTTDATYCEIYRLEGQELVQVVSIGPEGFNDCDNGWRAPLDHYPMFAQAIRAGDPWVVASPSDPRLSSYEVDWYERWGLKSTLSIPLLVGGEAIAVIDLEDARERDFGEHLDFMRSVAQLLAGAFEKAFLLERLEEGNRELRQLVDAGLEFGASLDLDEVLKSVAVRMCAAAGASCCDIYSLEGDVEVGLASAVAASDEIDPDFAGTTYKLADMSITRMAMDEARPVVVVDIASDDRAGEAERVEWMRFGYRSGLVIPLITRAEVVGFAEIFDARARDFERVPVLHGLAQVAAQAIANAALHAEMEQTAQRMTLMTEASLDFSSSLDLRDTLVRVGRRLTSVIDVPNCDIDIVRGDGTTYRLMSLTDGQIDERWIGMSLDLAKFPTLREALETHKPALVTSLSDPRLTEEGRAANRYHNEKSWVALPLVAKDKAIGIVDLVETRRERTFSEQEVTAAEAICRVAALAIDNADLYASLTATNRETEMLNAIAREAAASLDVGEIARSTTEHLRELVPFEGSAMVLTRGDDLQVVYSEPATPATAGIFEKISLAEIAEPFRTMLRTRPVVILDAPGDNLLLGEHPELAAIGALALVAIVLDDGLAGGLVLSSTRQGAFAQVDTKLLERVSTHLALALKNSRLYRDVKQMHLNNLKALSSALNAKDYYTLGHAARVSAYMVLLGSKLGWSEELIRGAEEAAYLHDIGKIGISDRVLLKPGKLNAEEWTLMRQHPVFSADIIRSLFGDELVLGVRHHHERWDGDGYPDGLRGTAIPVIARAMCVVDSYDAMSFQRPYRQALDAKGCLDELRRCSARQFDPAITGVFLDVLDELEERHRFADEVAAQAAARIDAALHAQLRHPQDEDSEAYREIAAVLREVRDANPPTMFLTTQGRLGRRYVMIVDAEDDPAEHSPLGSDVFPDEVLQVLPQVLAGEQPRVNALFADQYGVWVTGIAPIHDRKGDIVAVVAADLPPFLGAEHGGLRAAGKETLASILQSAAVRSTRGEIDAISDSLTGLYNHRYLHERLGEELRRAEELGSPLSLLFCDLDEFKEFNETLGHRAGDNALRSTAHILEQSIRHIDLAARYGGEEFVVALMGTATGDALEVAERIRERVHETFIAPSSDPLSISIGVATFPLDGTTKEELLDKADWAMHVAKRLGRNKVVSFSPSQPDTRSGPRL
jgi:diguanylate cyclase (GGDEF)-like protein/excisionase family DNA binding protein